MVKIISKKSKKKEEQFPEPSEEFKIAVRHAGSIVVDCQLCGRTHFGYDENLFDEEGEFENLMKRHKKNPDKYIYHSDEDYVSWGTVDGKQAVIDCQCHKLSLYEKLFWNNRYIIGDYFPKRAENIRKAAEIEEGLAKKVKGAVDSSN